LAQAIDDVEVGQAGLHLQDVGPFALIELALQDGFATVGRIHLIGALVLRNRLTGAGAGGRIEGLAEPTPCAS